MKVFLHFFSLLFFFLFLQVPLLFGQFEPEMYKKGDHQQQSAEIELKNQEELIWYEDFNGAIPTEWTAGSFNDFCSFQHTYSGPQGPFSIGMPALNSQTASNGFVILDSDLCSSQNPGGLTDAYLQSPAINLSSYEKVMLRFQHSFRYCCSPTAVEMVVEVSVDGVNWTSFDVRNGLAPNNTSANPVNQAVNISDVAAGHEQVWIRFRKTGASHYWWMIDDVMLVSFIENDLEITEVTFNNGYTMVPAGQQQPGLFSANVYNAGGLPQHDVVLSATVNRLLFAEESAIFPTLNPGQERNFSIAQPFLAPAKGLYQVELQISQLEHDQVPENNTVTVSFLVNDTVYSRSYPAYDPEVFIALNPVETPATANHFEVFDPMEATSVSFALHESSAAGAVVMAAIYEVNQSGFLLIAESDHHILAVEDITVAGSLEAHFITLPFTLPIDLVPGSYAAVVFVVEGDGVALAAKDDIIQPAGSSFVLEDEQWQQAIATPMINLNFGNNSVDCDPMYGFITESSLCGTASGSIEVVPLTGIGPFIFVWEDEPENNSALRENLMAGTYLLTVTDGYGCEMDLSVVLDDEEISLTFETTDAMCGTGGSITILPLNGEAPFTYSWSHDSTLQDATAQNLAPGMYEVIATDANNCQATINIEVGNIDDLPVNVVANPAYCGSASGSIELIPMAGTEPFAFSWEDYASVTGPLLENLIPGSYNFTVTDDSGCSFVGTATVTNQEYDLAILAETNDASCGLLDGAISVDVTNGQAPFSYNWSVGLDTPDIINLAPGMYQLTVTDNFGCASTQNFTIVNVGDKPQVQWVLNNSDNCGESNGEISIFPANPESQYTYTLLGDGKGLKNREGNPDFYLDGLAAGQYLVSVISEDGCEDILTLNISDEGAPEILAEVEGISCFGENDGFINITLEGSTDPQYQWNDASNSTTSSLSDLSSGLYTLQVTDGGCIGMATYAIEEPALLLANATINHIVCANEELGSIMLTTLGGTDPYSYIWSNGVSNRNLLDVEAGTYSVTITDYHLCTFTNSYTITGNEPLEITSTVNHADPDMQNGNIITVVSGGVPPYTFAWDSGHQSSMISGLAPDTYTLTLTDAVGCQVIETFYLGTVNVDEERIEEALVLYPNPVSDQLHLQINGMCGEKGIQLDVVSVMGNSVPGLSRSGIVAGEMLQLDVSRLAPGVYLLRLSCGEKVIQRKFMKQ